MATPKITKLPGVEKKNTFPSPALAVRQGTLHHSDKRRHPLLVPNGVEQSHAPRLPIARQPGDEGLSAAAEVDESEFCPPKVPPPIAPPASRGDDSIREFESYRHFDFGCEGHGADAGGNKFPIPHGVQGRCIQQGKAGALFDFHFFSATWAVTRTEIKTNPS